MERLIFGAQELFYAGIDPNTMRIKHGGCFDVGLKCGGWGRVVFKLRFEDRKSIQQELKKKKEE